MLIKSPDGIKQHSSRLSVYPDENFTIYINFYLVKFECSVYEVRSVLSCPTPD